MSEICNHNYIPNGKNNELECTECHDTIPHFPEGWKKDFKPVRIDLPEVFNPRCSAWQIISLSTPNEPLTKEEE